MEITVNNVNEALSEALMKFAINGQPEHSRNGDCLVYPEPVLTTYLRPQERVLFSPRRNANPWFHLFESLWMLAGRHDVAWITQYNSQFKQFSDDGVTFHGAYGHRWRQYFMRDQLVWIMHELLKNPESRRVVLSMWDPFVDPEYVQQRGKDAPCNTHAYVDCRNGVLNLTVCCRSNDVWWGAYGSNAVHFSVLQEVLAAMVGVPVGVYRQFSNNLHIYYATVPQAHSAEQLKELSFEVERNNEYISTACEITPYPVVGNTPIDLWFEDLAQFMHNPLVSERFAWRSNFFKNVAAPMAEAWNARKNKTSTGIDWVGNIAATDWQRACIGWIQRKEAARGATGTQTEQGIA